MDKQESGTKQTKTVEAVRDLVGQNLDKVEAQIDSTVDSAKEAAHELRGEAQEAADRTLTRLKGAWDRMQEKVEAQMALHPWVVLGSVLVVGYLLSRSQRSRRQ